MFDKDGNGFVSSSELKFVMSRLDVHFTDDELNEMILEADIDGDGQVSVQQGQYYESQYYQIHVQSVKYAKSMGKHRRIAKVWGSLSGP